MRLDELEFTNAGGAAEFCQLKSKSGMPFVVSRYLTNGYYARAGDWRFRPGYVGPDPDPPRGEVTQDLLMAQCLLHDYLNK